jgi:hypothetical protein
MITPDELLAMIDESAGPTADELAQVYGYALGFALGRLDQEGLLALADAVRTRSLVEDGVEW